MLLTKCNTGPSIGDYKFTYHFAWLPVSTNDGKIWLEKYKKVYEFRIRKRHFPYLKLTINAGDWDLLVIQRVNKK